MTLKISSTSFQRTRRLTTQSLLTKKDSQSSMHLQKMILSKESSKIKVCSKPRPKHRPLRASKLRKCLLKTRLLIIRIWIISTKRGVRGPKKLRLQWETEKR